MTNSLYGERETIAKSVLLFSPCVIANPGSVCVCVGGGGESFVVQSKQGKVHVRAGSCSYWLRIIV